MNKQNDTHAGSDGLLTCRNCGRELPPEQFERYATGTRRRVCRHCKYELYGKRAKEKWRKRQLLLLMLERDAPDLT